MISLQNPFNPTHLLFSASRHGLGWRTPSGDWARLKGRNDEPLYSERYGFAKVTRLPFGWRIVTPTPHTAAGYLAGRGR